MISLCLENLMFSKEYLIPNTVSHQFPARLIHNLGYFRLSWDEFVVTVGKKWFQTNQGM